MEKMDEDEGEQAMRAEVEQFERKLAAAIDRLCEAASPCLTLAWLQQALRALQAAQLDMMGLVPLHKLMQEQDNEWLKACVQRLEGLLHVCSILQRSMVDIGHYGMFVQLAVQAADKEQYSRARHLLGCCIDDERIRCKDATASDQREVSRLSLQKTRLQACKKLLLEMARQEQQQEHFDIDSPMGSALRGLSATLIFVLLVLAVCLTIKPSPVNSSTRSIAAAAVATRDDGRGEPLWWSSLIKLYSRIKGDMVGVQGTFALLHDLDKLDGHARELHELLLLVEVQDKECEVAAALSQGLQNLRICVDTVQAGLPLVELQIHEVSKVISAARTAALLSVANACSDRAYP